MIKGTAKIDGIALGEGTFSFLSPDSKLTAKAAFVSSTSGHTHGWTSAQGGWSKETLLKLKELRESMERDIAALHLSDVIEDAPGLPVSPTPDARGPSGLGDHLGSGDAPQV